VEQLRNLLELLTLDYTGPHRTPDKRDNGNPAANDKTESASQLPGEGDYKSAREYDADTRNFIKTYDVTRLARKAAPGSGEEAADILQAERLGNRMRVAENRQSRGRKATLAKSPTQPARAALSSDAVRG
jgi:hypothetical protein